MANQDLLNENGLQTKDNNTLLTEIQTNLQSIYSPSGEPINFDSNTPDGQFTEILSTLGTVVRELITETFNTMSPDNCNGAMQDKMYAINYITRRAGTFTTQNIDITVDRTVDLIGLDGSYNDENASAYAVSDDNGNIWYLIDSATLYAGTTSCAFRAKNKGQVIPVIGTITKQVTIIQGVVSIINNVGYTTLGYDTESDMDFRIRRARSTELAGSNEIDSMVGEILQLDGVTSVQSHINNTNSTDSTGTASHTIWLIIAGGANTEIADIIYTNQGGADTRGNVTVPITTMSGQTINVNFDRPTPTPLYIKFTAKIKKGSTVLVIDEVGTKQYIVNNTMYQIGESASTSGLTDTAQLALDVQGGNAYAIDLLISDQNSTATITSSNVGVTATIDIAKFETKIMTTGSYVFTYNSGNWSLNGDDVLLNDYGIEITGTPSDSDTLTIAYTERTYTDVINTATLANQFVLDVSRIYITTEQA